MRQHRDLLDLIWIDRSMRIRWLLLRSLELYIFFQVQVLKLYGLFWRSKLQLWQQSGSPSCPLPLEQGREYNRVNSSKYWHWGCKVRLVWGLKRRELDFSAPSWLSTSKKSKLCRREQLSFEQDQHIDTHLWPQDLHGWDRRMNN